MKIVLSEKYLCEKRRYKQRRRLDKARKKKVSRTKNSYPNLELLAFDHFGGRNNIASIRKVDEEIIKIPSKFSLVDSTAETIKTLRKVASSPGRASKAKIDWSETKILDLGAYTLSKQVERQARRAHLLDNFAATKKVKFTHVADSKPAVSQDYASNNESIFYHRFETRSEVDLSDTGITRKEQATEKFCEHVNKCLYPANLELSPSGIQFLGSTVLEVLDNAEAHVKHRNWYVTGSIAVDGGQNRCELVMYNFGRSIADSFRSLPDDHYAHSKEITPYVRKHRERKLRGKSRCLTEDNLITLAALSREGELQERE